MQQPDLKSAQSRSRPQSGSDTAAAAAVTTQACLAIYPLGQEGYAAVHGALEALARADVSVQSGNMNTIISGSESAVFAALHTAYAAAAEHGGTVMTVTVSNACPV